MSGIDQIVLRKRPDPNVEPTCFEARRIPLPHPGELPPGHVLVRTRTISIDPYVRARLEDRPSYKPPIRLGDVIPGEAVAEVVHSRGASFAPDELVLARPGWATHAVLPASTLSRLPDEVHKPSLALGALGMPGLTAFAGLSEYARMRTGETLVVGAATGPVGSMVGQLAKLHGLRVVGIAGGVEKCRALLEDFGFDAAVDHRSNDFAAALRAACPDGIDVDFETIGGRVFENVLPLLNRHARVLVCGLVGQWAREEALFSARDLLRAALDRSLSINGFVVGDIAARHRGEFFARVPGLITSGEIRVLEHVTQGLAGAPEALMSMLEGRHIGKTIIQID